MWNMGFTYPRVLSLNWGVGAPHPIKYFIIWFFFKNIICGGTPHHSKKVYISMGWYPGGCGGSTPSLKIKKNFLFFHGTEPGRVWGIHIPYLENIFMGRSPERVWGVHILILWGKPKKGVWGIHTIINIMGLSPRMWEPHTSLGTKPGDVGTPRPLFLGQNPRMWETHTLV